MPKSLREISELVDPDERTSAELDRIEWIIARARDRQKHLHGVCVADPDGYTIIQAERLGHELINEQAKRRGNTKSGRAEARIADLLAVLRAYDELPLSEWLELRTRHLR